MNPHSIGPQDIPDWRKRLTAVSHYILELESNLYEAKANQDARTAYSSSYRGTGCLTKKLTIG
jgi:hypothetical protein